MRLSGIWGVKDPSCSRSHRNHFESGNAFSTPDCVRGLTTNNEEITCRPPVPHTDFGGRLFDNLSKNSCGNLYYLLIYSLEVSDLWLERQARLTILAFSKGWWISVRICLFFYVYSHHVHQLTGGRIAQLAVSAGLNAQMAMQRYMNCGRQSRSRVPILDL